MHVTMFSATDGSMLGSIPISGSPGLGVASDGTYVWVASATSLSAYAPSGSQLGTRSGNYAKAVIFGAPGQMLVAQGPAWANVIETVTANGGSSATSPTFSGTFATWFIDGKRFLSYVGANVFVYSAAASQIQLVPLSAAPTSGSLGGGASYFWNNDYPKSLDFYQVGGNGQPVFTQSGGVMQGANIQASGRLLAIVGGGSGSSTFPLVDLTASPFAVQMVSTPFPYLSVFGADANGDWSVGNRFGGIYYKGSMSAPGASGKLGCGQVLGLTGSPSGVAALGTVGGETLVLDVGKGTMEAAIPLISGNVQDVNLATIRPQVNNNLQLSGDGRTLAASVSEYANQFSSSDQSLYIFSAPTWGIEYTFQYMLPTLVGFDMSLDGKTLGQTSYLMGSDQTEVTDISGATTILTSTNHQSAPLMAPDGAHFTITDLPRDSMSATQFYQGMTLVNAVPGSAVGWLDAGHLLVQTYSVATIKTPMRYSGTNVYDSGGNLLSSPPLPEIIGFDVITPTKVFSHTDQTIYDVTSGAVVNATGLPPQSVVAGPFIVSVSGHALTATRY